MSAEEKFRSIKAFRDYEQKAAPQVDPLRLLAVVKASGGHLRREEIAEKMGVDVHDLEDTLLSLFKQGLVKVEPGPRPEDDVVSL